MGIRTRTVFFFIGWHDYHWHRSTDDQQVAENGHRCGGYYGYPSYGHTAIVTAGVVLLMTNKARNYDLVATMVDTDLMDTTVILATAVNTGI